MNYTETEASAVIQEAEALQKEMHEFIDNAMKQKTKLGYDAMKDTFFMIKMAQLKIEIMELRENIQSIKKTNQ